jgi:hypothetical protein
VTDLEKSAGWRLESSPVHSIWQQNLRYSLYGVPLRIGDGVGVHAQRRLEIRNAQAMPGPSLEKRGMTDNEIAEVRKQYNPED